MQVKPNLNTIELLARFPKGFAVTPSGRIYEIVYLSQDMKEVGQIYPTPQSIGENGGYIVVRPPIEKEGDQRFLQPAISVQDFYKYYERQTFTKEEAERMVEFLNDRGVGIDHRYIVELVSQDDTYKVALQGVEKEMITDAFSGNSGR